MRHTKRKPFPLLCFFFVSEVSPANMAVPTRRIKFSRFGECGSVPRAGWLPFRHYGDDECVLRSRLSVMKFPSRSTSSSTQRAHTHTHTSFQPDTQLHLSVSPSLRLRPEQRLEQHHYNILVSSSSLWRYVYTSNTSHISNMYMYCCTH